MDDPIILDILIPLLFTVVFLIIGTIFGRLNESRHYGSLNLREETTRDILITDLRSYVSPNTTPTPILVTGEVVIATDYLKSFLAKIKKLLGGEVRSYLSLLERARREAIQRMVEQAREQGFNAICNLRIEMSDISGQRAKSVSVSVIASGTAYLKQD